MNIRIPAPHATEELSWHEFAPRRAPASAPIIVLTKTLVSAWHQVKSYLLVLYFALMAAISDLCSAFNGFNLPS